jgi:hypothetical protein
VYEQLVYEQLVYEQLVYEQLVYEQLVYEQLVLVYERVALGTDPLFRENHRGRSLGAQRVALVWQ